MNDVATADLMHIFRVQLRILRFLFDFFTHGFALLFIIVYLARSHDRSILYTRQNSDWRQGIYTIFRFFLPRRPKVAGSASKAAGSVC